MNQQKKKWYALNNILTGILTLFIILMIVNPVVKGRVIQGLMKIGLFQPKISKEKLNASTENEHIYQVNFVDTHGKVIEGNSLSGKVVFINFWATWCPPCIAEMPSINELYNEYKDNPDIIFLMVDADNDLQKSIAFMKDKKFQMPVFTAKGNIPQAWYSGTLPTTIVLDKNGNVAYRQTGAAEYTNKKFKDFILNLMNYNQGSN